MTAHPDRPMSDDEKLVRDLIDIPYNDFNHHERALQALKAFNRLMTIAPHGEMKSAEEWADMLAMKGLERNDMRNVVISIQQDASRTAKGDGALREALEWAMPSAREDVERYRMALSGPSITQCMIEEYEQAKTDLAKAEQALSATPTHDAVRDAALEEAAKECDRHAAFCKDAAHKGGAWDRDHLMTRNDDATYNAERIRRLKSPTVEKKA